MDQLTLVTVHAVLLQQTMHMHLTNVVRLKGTKYNIIIMQDDCDLLDSAEGPPHPISLSETRAALPLWFSEWGGSFPPSPPGSYGPAYSKRMRL